MYKSKNNNAPQWLRRLKLEQMTREFFTAHQFLELRTPLLVQSPGMEPHIRPITVRGPNTNTPVFLPTSPEFAIKKILARGAEHGVNKVFELAHSFRHEPQSPEHHPEFTMLEFYETHVTLAELQERVEQLFLHLAKTIHGQLNFKFLKNEINLETPWPRFRVLDLFKEHLEIDLRTHQTKSALIEVCTLHSIQTHSDDSWNDLYFKLWLNCVEPKLPKNKPCFVTHYPLAQSALCNPIADETGFLWANRFEVYLGQLELGNAFDELRDPVAQRKNFEHDQLTRTETYGDDWPKSPMDEALLNALPLMPPTCGIAIGFDRLAMMMLDASDIQSVLPLPSHWPTDPVL